MKLYTGIDPNERASRGTGDRERFGKALSLSFTQREHHGASNILFRSSRRNQCRFGFERQSPQEVVAIGGLMVSTFLTLLYVSIF